MKEVLAGAGVWGQGDTLLRTLSDWEQRALPKEWSSHTPRFALSSSLSDPSHAHPSLPPAPSICRCVSSVSPGGMRGWRRSGLRCHLLMDGGGLSPGARWAAQSRELSPSPALRGCRDTVGTACLSGSTGALGLTVSVDSETAPHRTGSGGIHSLSALCDTCRDHLGVPS